MLLALSEFYALNNGSKTFISNEPDNTLTEYFMTNNNLGNKSAEPILGEYHGLTFKDEPRRITPQPVKDFGVKSFPHVGAYGFYTPLFTPTSIMVIPINREQNMSDVPVVAITDTGTTIHLDITGNYECYRIVVRKDYFATEFVTYDTKFDFLPMYTGVCTISVIGHSNEISVTSKAYETSMTLVNRT